jgi:hypothetical protein
MCSKGQPSNEGNRRRRRRGSAKLYTALPPMRPRLPLLYLRSSRRLIGTWSTPGVPQGCWTVAGDAMEWSIGRPSEVVEISKDFPPCTCNGSGVNELSVEQKLIVPENGNDIPYSYVLSPHMREFHFSFSDLCTICWAVKNPTGRRLERCPRSRMKRSLWSVRCPSLARMEGHEDAPRA